MERLYLIFSFIFSPYLQSYLFILSYQVTWLRSSTVLCHSIYQSANTWLVHAFHYYVIDPWSTSRFTHVYLLVYIVGLVAYLSLVLFSWSLHQPVWALVNKDLLSSFLFSFVSLRHPLSAFALWLLCSNRRIRLSSPRLLTTTKLISLSLPQHSTPLPTSISMFPFTHRRRADQQRDTLTISISCWIFESPFPNEIYSVLFIALTWCLWNSPFWYALVAVDHGIFIFLTIMIPVSCVLHLCN